MARPPFLEACDARTCLDEILELFDRDGRPQTREWLEWYYNQCGDVPINSWVLRCPDDGHLSGLCSVVPRNFRFRNGLVRVGVAGNLVTEAVGATRAIGAIALLRSAQSLVVRQQLDILLGIPNLGPPMELSVRIGFHTIGRWMTYGEVFRSRDPLLGRGRGSVLLSPFVDFAAAIRRRLWSRAMRSAADLTLVEITYDRVDLLPSKNWPSLDDHFCVEFSPEMVKWRFLEEPRVGYSLMAVIDQRNNTVCGYFVIDSLHGRMLVCHCETDSATLPQLKAILGLCRGSKRYGGMFCVTTLQGSALSKTLAESGLMLLPPRFGGSTLSLTGFWRDDHPLAAEFATPARWNVFMGFNDV